MAHSVEEEDTLYASYDENIMLYHSADESEKRRTSRKWQTTQSHRKTTVMIRLLKM